jgi:hypothetical protein
MAFFTAINIIVDPLESFGHPNQQISRLRNQHLLGGAFTRTSKKGLVLGSWIKPLPSFWAEFQRIFTTKIFVFVKAGQSSS